MALIGTPVNVGQFGTTDKDLDRYKQAGEYALEAKMYRDDSLVIYNELKSDDIQEKIARAELAAKAAELAEANVTAMYDTITDDLNQIDGWIKDMAVTPYPYTAEGGETTITVPNTFTRVSVVYINGGRQEAGDDFTFNPSAHIVTFTYPLQAGDKVTVISNTVYEQVSTVAQTLQGLGGADYVITGDGESVQKKLNSVLPMVNYFNRTISPEDFRISTVMTDDALFDNMITWMSTQSDIVGSSTSTRILSTPRMVDLGWHTYTLNETHQLDGDWGIMNGTLLFGNTGRIVMGLDGNDPSISYKTRRHVLHNVHAEFKGTQDTNTALIQICRTFSTQVEDCNFRGGSAEGGTNSPNRSRYGLYIGSTRAWGVKITGGEFYGAKIACRVGHTNDHTGVTINGATFHHASVANLLLCNPAGFAVTGCNIEHSDPGGVGLAITSSTDSSGNPAQAGLISGNYIFNNGKGVATTTVIPAGVMIGYDVPGTTDFDNTGSLITSGNTAHSITVSENYIVSPNQQRAVMMRGLASLNVTDNKMSMVSDETIGVVFDGTCALSEIKHNRNQSSDASVDLFESTASNKINVTKRGGFLGITLAGDTVAGSNTYSARNGTWSVDNGMCTFSGWLVLDSKDATMDGNLYITLPHPCEDQQRGGCGLNAINVVNAAVDKPVTGLVLPNSTRLNLYVGNVRLKKDMVTTGTAFHFTIAYPVDLKQ